MDETQDTEPVEVVLRKQVAPYTQLPNAIVQTLQNPDALAIWTYLNSKSSNWRIIKGHLMTHFGLGRERYVRAMQVLRQAGLVSDRYVRDGTRIVGRELYVHLEPCIQVSVHTENVSDGKPVAYYETQDKSTKEKKGTKPPTPKGGLVVVGTPGREKYSEGFERFWDAFPNIRKGSKADAYKAWVKRKLEEHTDFIVQDVESKVESHRKWIDGFAPMATTYLNQSGWTEPLETTGSQGHAKETPFERTQRLQQESREDLIQRARDSGFNF